MNVNRSSYHKSKLLGSSVAAAALMLLFASMDAPAKTAKSKPGHRIVRDTVDTMLTPNQDGVTYDEAGVGRDAERKVVVEETVVPGTAPAPAPRKYEPKKAPSHKKSGAKHGGSSSKHHSTTPRDTVLIDTTQILGTPGSPTGSESRGMPGEKPVPGTKK